MADTISDVTGDGTMHSQPFSEYENIYLMMSRAFKHLNKEHWVINCVCTIIPSHSLSGAEIVARLRAAWKNLAREYPGLLSRPVGMEKSYELPTDLTVEKWAVQTFFEDDSAQADETLVNIGPRELPALFYLPRSCEVILLSQHWRTDGIGCCMLLDRLFQLFDAGPSPLVERPSLSPPLEVAAGAEFEETEEITSQARRRIEEFHAKAVEAGGMPYEGDSTRLPGRSTHMDRELSAEETKDVVQKCKTMGISVTAAIHTALAHTYFSFAESDAKRQAGYTTVMAANMRPFLPSPYNGTSHACQTYVASITPSVSYSTGFVNSAQALTEEYRTWCTPELKRSYHWLAKYNNDRLSAARSQASENASPPKPPSGITLSSLGNVERHLRSQFGSSLAVDKFRFGISMMTRQTILYAWTFRGQLTLSLNYNEAYYSQETAAKIVGLVRKNLLQGVCL